MTMDLNVNNDNREKNLESWIINCEGFRNFPYKDSLGYLTIGVGRCLDKKGLTNDEIYYLLRNDIASCRQSLQNYSWYKKSPPGIQDALVNMCFNLGIGGLVGFHHMLEYLDARNYIQAAESALASLWAEQVGHRATEIANIIMAGK